MMKTADETPTLYLPAAALVVFKPEGSEGGLYIEHYDMDDDGFPVNPRPLSVKEAQGLSKALDTREQASKAFLKPQGIIPSKVLHLNPTESGSVVWYTPPRRQKLHFSNGLISPLDALPLPTLVWVADKKRLSVFALAGKGKPRLGTLLYHAPFFNLYRNGNVCMGSVSIDIKQSASLEEFIAAWEGYFFGSYFSHLIDNNNPVKGNLSSLYKSLAGSLVFPTEELLPTHLTLKNLLR
jgi:PRTRC genetic system protein B